MPSRQSSEQPRSHRPETEVESTELPEVSTQSRAERNADIDDLLDEIDDVLEENAEEFVKSFVQKGGQ